MSTVRGLARLVASAGLLCSLVPVHAAVTGSGTLSPSQPYLSYAGAYVQANDSGSCNLLHACDDYRLSVDVPAAWLARHPRAAIDVNVAWRDASPLRLADYDLVVLDAQGRELSRSARGTAPEQLLLPAQAGRHDYVVRVIPFQPTGTEFTTTIQLQPTGAPSTQAASGAIAPRYTVYTPPAPLGESAGEPSIGYNVATGKGMYISGLQTLRITFPEDLASPMMEAAEAQWDDVSTTVTKTASLDPILFTDQETGRTFVSQLNSVVPPVAPVFIGANSLFAFTDDDGATWTPGQISAPDGSYDHQTVGGGPYPKIAGIGLPENPVYKNAVYYCAQAGVTALCSRSDTGGLTFNRPTVMYTLLDCGGIHGHLKVAADGTVYVPNRDCGNGTQGVVVSEDAGTTWTVRPVSTSTNPPSGSILDPSVGVARDGTLYFCYVNGDGHPHVAISHDKGASWDRDRDIGASAGIENSVFVEAVAGDGDRAACGFIGTTTAGDHQALDFPGIWYAYVATTYDGGDTWTAVNATPGDPIQREGGICNSGTGCTGNNRNLLDFNEITMDEKGRVIYGYSDGCVGDCVAAGPNSFSQKASIVRQSGGKPLLAAHDADFPEPVVPAQAFLSGSRDDQAAYLRWRTPDNGGSQIVDYEIYRGLDADHMSLVGHSRGKTAFNDRDVDASVASYVYKVVAVNAIGSGEASNTVALTVGDRVVKTGACAAPGVTVVSDPTADETDTLSQHDVQYIAISEPDSFAGKLVFTLKVTDLSSVPPGFRWGIRFLPPRVPATSSTGIQPEDFFVSMVSSDGPAPTFTYGTTGTKVAGEDLPGRVFTTIGNLDAGSGFNADGTITLVLDKSKIGGLAAGEQINSIFGSVRATGPSAAPGTGGVNQTIPDTTGGGAYTARQADLCLPNTAPLASLVASASLGGAPLSVSFDAAGSSDADGIDGIARYTFNFGDGEGDVDQAASATTHAFTVPGLYPVRLVVTDSRGKVSSNTALAVIDVRDWTPDAFRFPAKTGVARNTYISSATVTLTGMGSDAPISIRDGQYRINGGAWTNQPRRISGGDKLQLRLLSAKLAKTAKTATVKVGRTTVSFRVVTGN